MPTILRFRNFRVVIWINDHAPAHVHVIRSVDDAIVILACWDGIPQLREKRGTTSSEDRAIIKFVKDNQRTLCEAWRRFMATQQEINEAAERRDETLRRETGAVAVRFDKEARLIVLELNRGFSIYFSPERAQGLENASDEQLAEIEITSSGLGVYFPKLDADFSVPNLVKGRFGNDQWEAAWLAAHPTEAPQGKKSRRSKAA